MKPAIAAASLLVLAIPVRADATATTRDLQQRIGVDPHVGAQLPLATSFQDERGARRTLGEFIAGRPAVLALVYFNCPNLCSVTLDGLSRSSARADLAPGIDFRVIAISIDPREGPAQALAWQSRHRDPFGKPDWQLLTGDEASVRRIAQALGYRYFWDASQAQYAHPAGAVVVSGSGRIVQYLNGIEFPVGEMRHALSIAAENGAGTAANQFWLLCYHYEALAGQYRREIALALRLLGLATVAGLGFLLIRLSRTRA
jgi:protein SCO1